MKIIIVDDMEENLYLLESLLTGHGHEVVRATNGAKALEAARRDPPDLIISDILMPVMDGFALCREWKGDEGLKGIPFVFYTATYTDARDEAFALGLGAERFMIKPAEPDVFMAMVREVMEDAEAGRLQGTQEPIEDTETYLREYNETLIRKLESRAQTIENQLRIKQQILDTTLNGYILADHEGRVIDVNPAYCMITGYSREELLQMTIQDLEAQLTPEEIGAKIAQMLAEGGARFETRHRRKDGTIADLEVSIVIMEQPGSPPLVAAFVQDITSRKRTEAEIRFLGTITSQVTDSIVVTDTDYKITYINRAAEALFGYSIEELKGRTPDVLNVDPRSREIQEEVYRTISEGRSYKGEALNRRKDGTTFQCEFSVSAIRDHEGRIDAYVGVQRDVTERHAAELAVKESREQLRKLASRTAEVLETEKKAMSRRIHDDLGQVLTALRMDAAWLDSKLGSTQEQVGVRTRRMIGQLDAGIRTVQSIARELRPGVLDELGLEAALDWELGQFRDRSGMEYTFESNVSEVRLPEEVVISVFRVFQESLTNVARHSGARQVDVRLTVEQNRLEISVRDDGVGITREKADDRDSLGIIGMRERLRLLRGTLTIDGKPGRGTRVTVSVPLRTTATFRKVER